MLNKQYIHSAQIARKIDFDAINNTHIPSLVLMEHAAMASVDIISKKINKKDKICILCGPGNNGGDGMAIARLLYQKNYDIYVHVPDDNSMSHDETIQYEILKALSIKYSNELTLTLDNIKTSNVIIDCLFGNGLSRNIEGRYRTIIEAIPNDKYVFAIDIPSGIDATTGKVLGCAVHATKTIALDCFKEGHWIYPGKEYCNETVLVDIGIPHTLHEEYPCAIYVNETMIRTIFPKRDNHSHKGTFKKALMIGGSQSMPGAITMAAKACAHSGVGTLTIMEPDCIASYLINKMDFAMHLLANSKEGHFDLSACNLLKQNINNYDFITIGNGMGRHNETMELVKSALQSDKPVILDADAIWALKDQTELLKRTKETLLTPHIKEMSYLCKKSVSEILENPFKTVKEFINQYPSCTVILKSDINYIASNEEMYVYSKPNSALAKGGSGDVLCGILAGLYAHDISAAKASACACYIQSKCAETKKDPAFIGPEDLIHELNDVYKKLRDWVEE